MLRKSNKEDFFSVNQISFIKIGSENLHPEHVCREMMRTSLDWRKIF